LENHSPGRPPVLLDAEKEGLQRQVRDLEKRLYLAEKTIEVKDLLSAFDLHAAKKNKTKKQKGGKRRSGK
jgi:ABC-type lipopolysaccharide export system ATPase subunit